MTTADYALIVSISSLFLSAGALAWNVWQKFIFVKPRIEVSFRLMSILQPSEDGLAHPTGKKLLCLCATNMGPGIVIIFSCIGRTRRPRDDGSRYGLLNPIHGDPTSEILQGHGPFSGGLPAKLEAGETKTFYFPFVEDCFLADDLDRVGVNDTFNRNFWCKRNDMKDVCKRYKAAFKNKA